MHLMDLIHSKIELFRLEQRYTRRRNRRSTFVSEAQYVDGEYIYSPTSSYVAKCSAGGSSDGEEEAHRGVMVTKEETGSSGKGTESKSSRRLSKMGLGDWRKGKDTPDRANSRISVREIKWDSRS